MGRLVCVGCYAKIDPKKDLYAKCERTSQVVCARCEVTKFTDFDLTRDHVQFYNMPGYVVEIPRVTRTQGLNVTAEMLVSSLEARAIIVNEAAAFMLREYPVGLPEGAECRIVVETLDHTSCAVCSEPWEKFLEETPFCGEHYAAAKWHRGGAEEYVDWYFKEQAREAAVEELIDQMKDQAMADHEAGHTLDEQLSEITDGLTPELAAFYLERRAVLEAQENTNQKEEVPA